MPKAKYHGWIIVEPEEGFRSHIFVEFLDESGVRQRIFQGIGNSGCAKAVEFWDARVGTPIKLLELGRIGYRVFTEEEELNGQR